MLDINAIKAEIERATDDAQDYVISDIDLYAIIGDLVREVERLRRELEEILRGM